MTTSIFAAYTFVCFRNDIKLSGVNWLSYLSKCRSNSNSECGLIILASDIKTESDSPVKQTGI